MQSLPLAGIIALSIIAQAPPETVAVPVGSDVGDFELHDGLGTVRRLSDWQDSRLVVVVFVSVECPLAELYAERLAELAGTFGPRGVAFLGIAPNRRDTGAGLARFAQEHHLPFLILKDRGGDVAERLGATRSPSVVVLDRRRAVRYRGRIDDQYALGARRAAARRRDLAQAIEDLLAGRPVTRPETEAVGCPLDRPEPPSASEFTYGRDVAPILRRRCVGCHSQGQVAPFALTTYRKAAGWAEAIAEAVEERRMPPWHADPRYGSFANDAHLSEQEVRVLVAWARGGCPEGEPVDSPPPAEPPRRWSIPGPDLVVTMPRPFLVPAEGVVEYQQFEVDPGFREDRWVRAAAIRPGNRAVVHHCMVFVKPPGGGAPDAAEGDLGSCCLAATAPGTQPMVLPPGMAKRVPAGSRLLFVVHYVPNGRAQSDQTSLGLTFAPQASVRQEVATRLLADDELCIPPHASDHRVERSWRAPADLLLLALYPHMHLRGRSFRYEADYPDATTETLLFVPRYDFGWQHRYVLARPKRLPAGTLLRAIAHYDNSADNPANPDPDATVRAGLQSTDEMFNGYFDVALAEQDLTRPAPPLAALRSVAHRAAGPCLVLMPMAACGLALHLVRRQRICRPVQSGRG